MCKILTHFWKHILESASLCHSFFKLDPNFGTLSFIFSAQCMLPYYTTTIIKMRRNSIHHSVKTCMYSLSFYSNSDGSEPRPGLGFFSGLRLEFKGRVQSSDSTQAQTQLFEKGLENCSFYIIEIRGPSKLRLLA